jgi:hypothetical protein
VPLDWDPAAAAELWAQSLAAVGRRLTPAMSAPGAPRTGF